MAASALGGGKQRAPLVARGVAPGRRLCQGVGCARARGGERGWGGRGAEGAGGAGGEEPLAFTMENVDRILDEARPAPPPMPRNAQCGRP